MRYYYAARLTSILKLREFHQVILRTDVSSIFIAHSNYNQIDDESKKEMISKMISNLLESSENEDVKKIAKKGNYEFKINEFNPHNIGFSIFFPTKVIEGNLTISDYEINQIKSLSI